MGKRVKAWSLHNKKPIPAHLRFITQNVDLLNSRDVADLAKAAQAVGGCGGTVVLDAELRRARRQLHSGRHRYRFRGRDFDHWRDY